MAREVFTFAFVLECIYLGTSEPATMAEVNAKVAELVRRWGPELDLMLRKQDATNTGMIPVRIFSECLKAFSDVGSDTEELCLSHADRKVLYRTWASHGQVPYRTFLRDGGLKDHGKIIRETTTSVRRSLSVLGTAETVVKEGRHSHVSGLSGKASPLMRVVVSESLSSAEPSVPVE